MGSCTQASSSSSTSLFSSHMNISTSPKAYTLKWVTKPKQDSKSTVLSMTMKKEKS